MKLDSDLAVANVASARLGLMPEVTLLDISAKGPYDAHSASSSHRFERFSRRNHSRQTVKVTSQKPTSGQRIRESVLEALGSELPFTHGAGKPLQN
jgi:hypothetical protein